MLVLGLCDGHDSGACLVEDGRILAAVSSERLTRRKRQPGFPGEAMRWCLERRGVTPRSLDCVAVAERAGRAAHRAFDRRYRRTDPNLPLLRPGNLASMVLQNLLARSRLTAPLDAAASRRLLSYSLAREGVAARPRLVDHHLAHAVSAARGSGLDDALVLTMDAFGDGWSGGAWLWRGGRLSTLRRFAFPHSPALLYGLATALLGFCEGDEGKVAGMAATGNAAATQPLFATLFSVEGGMIRLRRPLDLLRLGGALSGHAPADIAAGVQAAVEEVVCALVAHWARETGAANLCLAGGLFANVRLNQRAARAAALDDLYVFPHMGDGGLCAGAALAVAPDAPADGTAAMFVGPPAGPLPADAISAADTRTTPLDDDAIEAVARVLARGGTVGIAAGAMEFGPRALGNRSILMPADDPHLARRMNAALGRPDVMPLAPVVREGDLARVTGDPPWSALRFMTVTVDALPGVADRFPVAVHADGTMRLQVATPDDAPLLHAILSRYNKHLDPAMLINTSFNRHTEPIIGSAQRALELYQELGLDALVLDGQALFRSAS